MLNKKNIKVNDELIKRLGEFYNEPNIYKFSNKDICFEDKSPMSYFWTFYNGFIRNSELDVCKAIMEQYNVTFLGLMKQQRENIYNKFLELFLEEKNYNKYNRHAFVLFPNGNNMGDFWDKHKKEILSSDELICIKLQRQYELYKFHLKRKLENLPEEKVKIKMIKNENYLSLIKHELEEFKKIDYSKFESGCDATLSNGVNANSFWKKNYDSISISNNELCEELMLQYEDYQIITDDHKQSISNYKDDEIYNFINRRSK